MRTLVVVDPDEFIELCLEFGDRGCSGLASEPFLEGLVEPFDFPACRGMVRRRILLNHPETCEEFLERGVLNSLCEVSVWL